jgi:hypothetical protein
LTGNVGLLGELQVEQRLVESGWHPVRLDTGSMAANADLLAMDRRKRVSIQVKSTDASSGHSHAHCLGFGSASAYLGGGSVFNGKESPIVADVVVGVGYQPGGSRFAVMPVAFAEAICRLHCDYWAGVPKRESGGGGQRSNSFTIYLPFTKVQGTHVEHHSRIQRNPLAFEDRWDVLAEPVDRLHDPRAWPLID